MLKRVLVYFRSARKAAQPPLNTPYFEKHTKHRNIMNIYDLWPIHSYSFISPSATVVGEVKIEFNTAVYNGCVIRGDINSVYINEFTVIGPNTVIHTAASLPTGTSAEVNIGIRCLIGPRCTLYSCTIDDFVHVGEGSVILEGSRLEKGCMIAPGSVVPPGRLIPSKQLWGGNPVRFIKNLLEPEDYSFKDLISRELEIVDVHKEQFGEYGHAYMHDS